MSHEIKGKFLTEISQDDVRNEIECCVGEGWIFRALMDGGIEGQVDPWLALFGFRKDLLIVVGHEEE